MCQVVPKQKPCHCQGSCRGEEGFDARNHDGELGPLPGYDGERNTVMTSQVFTDYDVIVFTDYDVTVFTDYDVTSLQSMTSQVFTAYDVTCSTVYDATVSMMSSTVLL
ncbi:hypothetical protein ACOMHN_023886 [Nucella lapillus]